MLTGISLTCTDIMVCIRIYIHIKGWNMITYPCPNFNCSVTTPQLNLDIDEHFMMTSSNENIFCVIGPLCGDSPVTGEFPSQRPVTRSFDISFALRLNTNGWVNNREAGDLRRHRTHYAVTVMYISYTTRIWLLIHVLIYVNLCLQKRCRAIMLNNVGSTC